MNMGNMLNKMFGQIEPGLCRLSMNGGIAIKVGSGEYKTYNIETGRLTNCSNFVFNIGEEFFFVIPTNKVAEGDIILVNGEPRCVVKAGRDEIIVINYKTSVKETILPERHVFMGNTYFYGKIVSMFGNGAKAGKGKKNIFKYMMMNEMLKGNSNTLMPGQTAQNGMNPMAMWWMMGNGGFGDMFEDMFDFDMDDPDEEEETPKPTRRKTRTSKSKPKGDPEITEEGADE